MYVRPPSSAASKMKLPENYGGSTFSHTQAYGDMPPPTHTHSSITDLPGSEYISQRPDYKTHLSEPMTPELISALRPNRSKSYGHELADTEDTHQVSSLPVQKKHLSQNSSLLSSLLPNIDIGDHFPFGHGLGGEELLILAVMFLVYLSEDENGKTDNEFLILLGLLLFAG